MIKSIFLKIIVITVLIGGFGKTFASAENFSNFSKNSVSFGIHNGIPALVFLLIPFINNKIKYGEFFAKRPGKLRMDYDTNAQIFLGFPLGIISALSFGIAAISKFAEYGIKNQLFSTSQFFTGLSGIFTFGSLVAAKKWHDISHKLKNRQEKSEIVRSQEYTKNLEEKKNLPKVSLAVSSLAAVIFAISAIRSK